MRGKNKKIRYLVKMKKIVFDTILSSDRFTIKAIKKLNATVNKATIAGIHVQE